MSRTCRARVSFAVALLVLAAGCQDYNFNPVGHCLIQTGTKLVTLSNLSNDGADWERECSVELINPSGAEGFNVNAGLRIRGGWSRHNNYPKHAFRLFFKEEYGDSKLYYPLFEDEGIDRFDKVDLRCEQNYSWANYEGEHNTFIREVFLRDAQGETGSPYTRSRYYQ
jgi:hypothetical protein